MDRQIKLAAEAIENSRYTVAFTGAGVSVESGIPPFRGRDGLWNKYDPNCLNLDRFYSDPLPAWKVIKEIFYDFFGKAKPNDAHKGLGVLEKNGKLQCVITQNIDNLHQEGGSKNVVEFHGTSSQLVCPKCGRKYPAKKIDFDHLPPMCKIDGEILKPDFVFFGEGIPEEAFYKSHNAMKKAEVVIIVGTTGEIVPASMLPSTAKNNGAVLIEINPEESNYTNYITDIFIQEKASVAMKALIEALGYSL